MKNLKTILERKSSPMQFPKWAKFIFIDLENQQIEFLDSKEVSADVKTQAKDGNAIINDEEDKIYISLI